MANVKAAGATMKPRDQGTALFLAVARKEALELQTFFQLQTNKEEPLDLDVCCVPRNRVPSRSRAVPGLALP